MATGVEMRLPSPLPRRRRLPLVRVSFMIAAFRSRLGPRCVLIGSGFAAYSDVLRFYRPSPGFHVEHCGRSRSADGPDLSRVPRGTLRRSISRTRRMILEGDDVEWDSSSGQARAPRRRVPRGTRPGLESRALRSPGLQSYGFQTNPLRAGMNPSRARGACIEQRGAGCSRGLRSSRRATMAPGLPGLSEVFRGLPAVFRGLPGSSGGFRGLPGASPVGAGARGRSRSR